MKLSTLALAATLALPSTAALAAGAPHWPSWQYTDRLGHHHARQPEETRRLKEIPSAISDGQAKANAASKT